MIYIYIHIYISFMLISEARLNFSFTASIGLSKRSAERRGGTPWHYLKGAQEHFQDCGFALATMLGLICACQIEERCCTVLWLVLVIIGMSQPYWLLVSNIFLHHISTIWTMIPVDEHILKTWGWNHQRGLFEMKAFPRVGGRGYHMSPWPLLVLEFIHPL